MLILNEMVWDGLIEKVIKHEGNIKAEKKEFLFTVLPIANQSLFHFIFICTNDTHLCSCRKITYSPG